MSRRLLDTLIGSLLVASSLCAAPVFAAPQYVRVALASDASQGVTITWTAMKDPEANLEYGTQKGVYSKTVSGKTDTIDNVLGTIAEVELTGLTPDTTYYYRVGGSKGGWSNEHSFRTGPKPHPTCGTVRFVYAGDSRSESIFAGQGPAPGWMQLLQQALAYKPQPRFLLHGGDIVYTGSDRTLWADYLAKTAPYSAALPVMGSIGNHDDGPGEGDAANYNRIFGMPRSGKALGGSGTEDFYAFTYANAIFISLSTATFKGGTSKFQQQADWLDKVLTANPKRWKIVGLHHPIYTENLFINHPPNEVGQNASLVAVFNKHHVDIVMQSHNHYYERFAPSFCKNPGSKTPCPVASPDKGTIYMTSGGGGALAFPFAGFPSPARPAAAGGLHLVLFDISDHTLTLKAYGVPGGKQIDSLTIKKQVTGPDPCAAPAADAGVPKPDAGGPDIAVAPDAKISDAKISDAKVAATDGLGPDSATDGKGLAVDGTSSNTDGGTSAEGNSAGDSSSGCSCELGARHAGDGSSALLLLGLLALALWRRRRA